MPNKNNSETQTMQTSGERNPFIYKFSCYSGEEPINNWSRQLCSLISNMEVEVDTGNNQFECEWKHIPLGSADLNFFSTSGRQTVFHQPTPTQSYELMYLHKGPMEVQHNNNAFFMEEGQLVLIDNRVEWVLNIPQASNCMTMHINKNWIQRWLAHPDNMVARPLGREQIWSQPVTAALEAVYRIHHTSSAIPHGQAMADSLGSLVGLLFGDGNLENKQNRYHKCQYQHLVQFLYQQYDDRELNATLVADALKISLRQLHKICAIAGKSFSNTLIDIRLERAKNMLENHDYHAYQICEIAWACGFSDPSHFSRRFRSKYALTPEMFRKSAPGNLRLLS